MPAPKFHKISHAELTQLVNWVGRRPWVEVNQVMVLLQGVAKRVLPDEPEEKKEDKPETVRPDDPRWEGDGQAEPAAAE